MLADKNISASWRRLRPPCEALARDFGQALSALLRIGVDVAVSGVEQLAYDQFCSVFDQPACCCALQAAAPGEFLMLDVEPVILLPMIDRMLGGTGDDQPPLHRPLTEIESRLAARVLRLFLQACARTWRGAIDPPADELPLESDPQRLRAALPADEAVVVIGFTVAFGQSRGLVRLCLAERTLERLGDGPLLAAPTSSRSPPVGALAEVSVALAETTITAAELAELRPGDVVATETDLNSPASVSIDDAKKFYGQPGVYRGRKAVRLTELLDAPPDGQA